MMILPNESSDDYKEEIPPTNSKQQVIIICNCVLMGIQFMTVVAFYQVVPFYVLDTPEHGWTSTDFALIFSASNVGVIVGSQSRSIASIFTQNERASLFIGHLSQIIAGIVGWTSVSSLFGFDYLLFVFGCFLLGVNNDCTIIQSYTGIISNGNREIALRVMNIIGKLFMVFNIIFAFTLPLIFDNFGFLTFCLILICIQCVALLILFFEWRQINALNRIREMMAVLIRKQQIIKDAKDKIMQIVHTNNNEENVNIPLCKLLSPTMFLLIFVSFITAYCYESYYISYPIVFDLDWNISASMAGYLISVGNVIAIILLNASLKYSEKCILFRFPFNICLPICLFMIGNGAYVIVYKAFIAYSFHLMISNVLSVSNGLEMVARVFVCPPNAFNKLTSINGFIQSFGYLIASLCTPFLFNIDSKLAFLIIFALNAMLIAIIFIIYYQRRAYLLTFFDEVNARNYLQCEGLFYERINKSTQRRKCLMIDQKIRDQIRRSSVDASALLFAPMISAENVRDTLIAMHIMTDVEEIRQEIEAENLS